MLEWTWLIPIIAFAVWVINNLQQRQREAAKQVAAGGPRPGAPRPRSTASEIDKFLEEINRRRQQQERPESTAAPPPVRRQQPTRTERTKPGDSRRQRRAKDNIPVEFALVEPSVPEVLPASTVEAQLLPSPILGTARRAVVPPHLARLRELLSGPDGLRTAFLLKEVFGPPKARRGR
jgi:hypothetical protein